MIFLRLKNFFSHPERKDDGIIQYYETITIGKNSFTEYLFKKMNSLFDNKNKYGDCYKDGNLPDIKYINMLLDENNSEIKSKNSVTTVELYGISKASTTPTTVP